MKKLYILLSVVLSLITSSAFSQSADVVFHNGNIITMEGETPEYIEAIAIKGDKIINAGKFSDLKNLIDENTKIIDLNNKTLLPGFIEPHLHPSLAAVLLSSEIIAANDWVLPGGTKKAVVGHDEYIRHIREAVNSNAKPGVPYMIWGYHQLWHGELSRSILNEISQEQPIGVIHRSFHEIYVNDAFLKLFKIKEDDFRGNPQVEWDKGHFFEGGWLALVPKIASLFFNPDTYGKGLEIMSQIIHTSGVTTVCEPGFPNSNFDLEYSYLKKEMDKLPPYDVYLIPNGTFLYSQKGGNDNALEFINTLSKYNTPNINFLPQQIKLFYDGAIYSQLMQMIEGYTDGHQGQWITPPELFSEQLKVYWKLGYKIHTHSNGDKAIQMLIENVNALLKDFPRTDHRFTMHHMGYFSQEQTKQMSLYGMEASVNPYYLWALSDKYSEFGLGKDRAENLVRIKSLYDNHIPFSFHSDFPMAPVASLNQVWTAVNRVTSENSRFSQDQRITPYSALMAVTINAARTLNLENSLGSIKAGKIANFTILSTDPLKSTPMDIKDIKVFATVFKGKVFLIEK